MSPTEVIDEVAERSRALNGPAFGTLDELRSKAHG